MRMEQHQYSLWQELWQKVSRPALWILERRVSSHDKDPVIDEATGYVMSYVSDNPVTLEIVPPKTTTAQAMLPSSTVSHYSCLLESFLDSKI